MRRAWVVGACLIAMTPIVSIPAASEVQVGAASEPFALPSRVPLAGYSRRKGRASTGVHDSVGVRALVMEGGGAVAALVSADLLIVDERLAEAVRQRLRDQPLPPDLTLILAATHTHSGPGAYGRQFLEKLSMGHFDPAVFEVLVQAMTQAVTRAYAERAPAHVAYHAVPTRGLVVNRMDPAGAVDPELVVVAFSRPGHREPFAVVVNFAAHPTTLGAWNRQLSADYPGVIARELAQRFPGAVILFVAGAVGDQAPVKAGDAYAQAEAVGRPLADHAAALLANVAPEAPATVHALQRTLPLPPAKVRIGRLTLPRWLGQRLVDDDATLSLLRIGTTVFLGVPCDLTAGLGATLKAAARARGLQPVIVGFASDYIGYCVPEALYEAKAYEASLALNGPKAGELVVSHLQEMLDEIGDR